MEAELLYSVNKYLFGQAKIIHKFITMVYVVYRGSNISGADMIHNTSQDKLLSNNSRVRDKSE